MGIPCYFTPAIPIVFGVAGVILALCFSALSVLFAAVIKKADRNFFRPAPFGFYVFMPHLQARSR